MSNPSSPHLATHTQKRALFIINPRAGNGRGREVAAAIAPVAEKMGWEVDSRETSNAGEEVKLGSQAATEGWSVVIVVGGDGTVHGVANGLLEHRDNQTALAFVPVGTGNDFAGTVGIDKRWPAPEQLRRVLNGKIRRFDVGIALDEYFINSIGLGFTAAAAKNLARFKRIGGFAAYIVSVYHTIIGFKLPSLKVETSEIKRSGPTFMVEITLGRTTGGGFKVCPDADPSDGQLDVCLVKEIGILKFIRYVPRVIRGTHVDLSPVQMDQTNKAWIEIIDGSKDIHLDGELRRADKSKVNIEIHPGVLPVLCVS